MSEKMLADLRKRYPIGCIVRLIHMEDVSAPPIGTEGIVRGVDDVGDIMVNWSNGSILNVVHGEDVIQRVGKRIRMGF